MTIDTIQLKRQAAAYAADLVQPGMVVGLGHGSTAIHAVAILAEKLKAGRLKDVIGVPGILTTCRGRPAYFIAPKNAFYAVREWLTSVAGTGPHTPAGKNFAGFDLQFLIALDDRFRTLFRHRTLDAGSLLVDWSDQCPASLDLLKQRHLGGGTVAHDAIDDALDVIRLLRTTYPKVTT